MENTKIKNNLVINIVLIIMLFVPAFLQNVTLLGQNRQLIIGTIVNIGLFLCASFVNDKKKIIAFSTLPSISSICSGLLFSGLTKWSMIMLPFIWIGNLSLIYLSKYLGKKTNYITSRGCGIFLKVLVIYLGFLLVSHIFSFPQMVVNVMSKSMGITQLYTALCGFVTSSFVVFINDKIKR